MSRGRPVLAPVPAHEEARWRAALSARVRPEFRVDRYLPPREHLVLYGPHCSVAGCDRPGNELFVGPARLCQRHARIWVEMRDMTIEAWLSEAPAISRRSEATGMPRYDLSSDSPVRRDELWDLADHPEPATVATGSAKRFQLFLLQVRRELLDREPSWRDEVWPRELYAPFDRGLRSKLPAGMDFGWVQAPWLRELAQRVCWTRLSVEAVSPGVAWTMVRHVVEFERWAGERLGGPETLTRELLLDYLAHVRVGDLDSKTKAGKLVGLRSEGAPVRWYYRALYEAFLRRSQDLGPSAAPALEELGRTVQELESLAGRP